MNRLFLLLFGAVSLVAHAQVPDYVPTEGLVAWYPFNGNAYDESGNGYHGLGSELNSENFATDRFGVTNQALSLSQGQFVECPNWFASSPNQTAWTMAIWIKNDGADSEFPELIIGHRAHFKDKLIQIENDSIIIGNDRISTPLNITVTAPINPTDLNWHHLSLTSSADKLQLFFDGELVTEAERNGQISNWSDSYYGTFIGGNGHDPNWSNTFLGDLDDAGIWNRALTEEEVLALYNAESPTTPCYVPTDNLEYWSDFDGEVTDQSGNGVESNLLGSSASVDRNGNNSGALSFNGIDESAELYVNGGANFDSELTLCAWVRPDGPSVNGSHPRFFHSSEGVGGQYDRWFFTWSPPSSGEKISFGVGDGTTEGLESEASIAIGEWTHIASVFENGNVRLYLDGQLTDEGMVSSSSLSHVTAPIHIASAIGNSHFHGAMDEVGIWSEALSSDQILQLYTSGASVSGCTDSSACNFDESASCDNGDCIYPPVGATNCDTGESFCADGTTWNSATQSCDPLPCESAADAAACGPGTYWDELESLCLPIETCQDDLDGDGVIGVNDLMQLLSSFGTDCAPAEEPESAEWTCGDPVSYHGYDYATVQIGEQCWFAENLRTEHYANGDAIPGGLTDGEWSSTTEGARAVYNNDESNLADYGRLYNWYAVDDSRGVCPSGWQVPTDGEYMTLEMTLGMSESEANQDGYRGTDQGTQMKSSPSDTPSWNGTNTSGFSALTGGLRYYNGNFYNEGNDGYFWSSSPSGSYAWYRRLGSGTTGVARDPYNQRDGISVRCLRDAE